MSTAARPNVCSLGIEWAPVANCPNQWVGTFGSVHYHAVYDDPLYSRWYVLFSDGKPFRQLVGKDLAAVVESLEAWLGPAAPRGPR